MSKPEVELTPELKTFIEDLNGAKLAAHDRISVGIWLAFNRCFASKTLTHDQKLDLFQAGMHAYRMAAMSSFFHDAILSGDSLERLKRNGGISASAIAAMALMQEDYLKKSSEKFLTLCEMID
jgi:hypothetical protein